MARGRRRSERSAPTRGARENPSRLESPWAELRKIAHPRRFQAGEVIARAGQPLLGAFLIQSGLIEVSDQDHALRGVVLGRGDSFGEYALVPGSRPFPPGLQALTEIEALFVRYDWYLAAQSATPGLDDAVKARIKRTESIPDLVRALKRHPELSGVAIHQLVDLAQRGEAIGIANGRHLPANRLRRDDWVFVAGGALDAPGKIRLTRGGSFRFRGNPLEYTGLDDAWIVRIAAEQFRRFAVRTVRSDGGLDPGRPGRRSKQVFLLSTRRSATPLAALTALVADQLREDLPGHRVGVLVVRSRRGEARPEPRALARARTRGLEVVEVDAEPAAMAGAVRQMRADTVLVDASARPLDWAEANLGGLVSKVVFLAREAFEPSPEAFREHPCVRTVLVRECPVGAQMAYHPRTVRLSFDSLEALSRLALDELPSRDRDSVARLSRALSARRVGLALGGGAALGYAHIALLQELAAANMPVDLISGVSFGSLVAGLYVSGGVAALDALLEHSVTFQAVLMASTAIPPLTEWFLNGQLENRRLEYVETPFFPVSLNLQTCDEWSPTKGTLAAGIRGSSALPGFFSPFIAPGVRSVDGTFVNNVPEEILIREGANFVISSNVIEAPEPIPESRWGQVLSLAPWNRMKDNLRALAALNRIADDRDRRLADLRFQPPRSGVPMWDFSKGRLIVERTRPEAKRFAHEAVRQWIGRSQP